NWCKATKSRGWVCWDRTFRSIVDTLRFLTTITHGRGLRMKKVAIFLLVTALMVLGISAGAQDEPLLVFGAYATPIEEPWDGVIHAALVAAQEDGRIEYEWQDEIGYSGDMEIVLREVAEDL